jgi:CO/xanthine dehydrogenase FAD-binding subunit
LLWLRLKEPIMPKRPSIYHRPTRLEEALRLLQEPGLLPLGGGTGLLAADAPGGVVDLQALDLNQVVWQEKDSGLLHVGATTRLVDLAAAVAGDDRRNGPQRLLVDAVQRAGPNTFRNAATVAGVVATRAADSELLAAWLLLEAHLTVYARGGDEAVAMPLADYLQADERPPGLITAIFCRWQPGRSHSERVSRTPADMPIVSISLWQPEAQPPRLAATGLAARPFRLTAAETMVANDLDDDTIERAAAAVKAANGHPGDFRGDAPYRAEMGAVLTRRVLQTLRPPL